MPDEVPKSFEQSSVKPKAGGLGFRIWGLGPLSVLTVASTSPNGRLPCGAGAAKTSWARTAGCRRGAVLKLMH